MVRALFILVPVVLAFWIFTIVDCAVQPPTRHRGVSKPTWLVIVIVIPVLGGILWLTVGRVRKSAVSVYRAPDDDPEFLGSLIARNDQDARIRQLEEELAKLDSEDDDPRPAPGTDQPHPDGDDDPRGQRGAAS